MPSVLSCQKLHILCYVIQKFTSALIEVGFADAQGAVFKNEISAVGAAVPHGFRYSAALGGALYIQSYALLRLVHSLYHGGVKKRVELFEPACFLKGFVTCPAGARHAVRGRFGGIEDFIPFLCVLFYKSFVALYKAQTALFQVVGL